MNLKINLDRLRNDLEDLGRIGRDPNGGVTRPSFSRADLEARAWLKKRIEDAGLAYRLDGAGNIFGRKDGSGKAVMVGSHIDTVINGGMFDARSGCSPDWSACGRSRKAGRSSPAAGISRLHRRGRQPGRGFPRKPRLHRVSRQGAVGERPTQVGRPLKDILKGTEFTIDGILEAHATAPDLEAYLELHIEQGPVLETEDVPIGIVTSIAGKHYRWCSFSGTPGMPARRRSSSGGTPSSPGRLRFEEHAARRHSSLRKHGHGRQGSGSARRVQHRPRTG